MSDTAVSDDFTEQELDSMETELEKLANGNDPDSWVNDELAALEEEFEVENESESEPDAAATQKLIQTITTARKLVADLRAGSTSESAELQSIKQSLATVERSSGEIRAALQSLDALLTDLQDRVAVLEKR